MGRLAFAARSLTCLRCTSRSSTVRTRAAARRRSRGIARSRADAGRWCGLDRRARLALAGERRLSRQLRRAIQGRLHEQRVTAFHPRHGLRLPGQPGARSPDRQRRKRSGHPDPCARDGEPRARVRDARSDALHERRPALPRRLGSRLVRMARPRHEPAVRRALGEAIAQSDATVAVFASGSLSHRFNDDGSPEESIFRSAVSSTARSICASSISGAGVISDLTAMLPEYAQLCHGEGGMHDTVMLLGMLGWDRYDKEVEILTDYFPSLGPGS